MQAIKEIPSNNYIAHPSIELVCLLGFLMDYTSPVLWNMMVPPIVGHLSMHPFHLISLILA